WISSLSRGMVSGAASAILGVAMGLAPQRVKVWTGLKASLSALAVPLSFLPSASEGVWRAWRFCTGRSGAAV
ncbi:MAG: hypothetical protein ACLQKK_20100, partial [Rhodomicrobium sp.]